MTEKIGKNSHLFIGKLTGTFGLKGALKLFTDWTLDLTDFVHKTLYIILPNNDVLELILEKERKHKRNTLLFFKEINSINKAEKLIGSSVFIDEKDLPRDEEDIYFTDIENAKASDEEENVFGKIVAFIEQKNYDILVIELTNGKRIEIPYLDEFIKDIDVNGKKVIFFTSRINGFNED